MKLEPISALGRPHGIAALLDGLAPVQPMQRVQPAQPARLTERSDIGCLLVSCAVEPAACVDALEAASQISFPRGPGSFVETGRFRACWLSPRAWIVQCPHGDEAALAARVHTAFACKSVHAAAYADHLCWLELAGPDAARRLAGAGYVSLASGGLPSGRAKRTTLAGVAVIVLRLAAET